MYDIAIIGSGPGGYAASIHAAELGLKVCIIEQDAIGGTCLNWGCVPTKSIVESLKVLHYAKKADDFGIDLTINSIDFSKIQSRKDEVITRLRQGAEALLKSKNIETIKGKAILKDKNTIDVSGNSVNADNLLIATGSLPAELENIKIDHKHILSSKDILNLDQLPEDIVIIGGGFIGCEFASIFTALGIKVTIVELMDRILPEADSEISRRLESEFKKRGIVIKKSSEVAGVEIRDKAILSIEGADSIESDRVLLCVGRKSNIADLGLEGVGVGIERGRVVVDDKLKTVVPGIYAIGDAIGGYYLAHAATYEGMVAVENIRGKETILDYSGIPSCIFTHPEISSVGITEDKAKELGIAYKVTKLPFAAVSKAHIAGETSGLIKLITDPDGDRILGAHILGSMASELISDFSICIKNGLSAQEIADTIYAHPTLSEGIWDLTKRIS